ncbi:MAG: glucosidase family protein [Saccharofermentanales bacterium]
MERLETYQIGHASWGCDVYGMDAEPVKLESVRNFAFRRKVKLEEVYIYPIQIRWIPTLTGQPKHLIFESFDSISGEFIRIKEVILDEFKNADPHKIALDGIETDNIRIICDLEYPVAPSHSEQWSREEVVPFAILDGVYFFGEYVGEKYQPPYNPPFVKGLINPRDCGNVTAKIEAETIYFESGYFKIGFSLRRPLILFLGWDDMGLGKSKQNLLFSRSVWRENIIVNCGPVVQEINATLESPLFTGNVEVDGTKVSYKNVHVDDRYSVDYIFNINEKGMDLTIEKRVFEDIKAYEHDDLRLIWDMETTITGTLSMPYGKQGRTGTAPLPVLWNAPGHGCAELAVKDGKDNVDIQNDTWRYKKVGWCGIDIGVIRDRYGFITVKKGTYKVNLTIKTSPLMPKTSQKELPAGLLRNWSSGFTFRTELGGFSNNSSSCSCHLSQQRISGFVPYTQENHEGLKLADMLEYTMELSLRGGTGYGDCREFYMDTDPSVLIGTGRVFEIKNDAGWVKRMYPYIKETFNRMIANCDETGLLVCRSLTGNSGSKKWSCNAYDVLSFGHYDAYTNGQAYVALKYFKALAGAVGDMNLAEQAGKAADKLKESFPTILTNPKTGLISGWRSADGQHHDYAFTSINYSAICYDLVSPEQSIHIIDTLEKMMQDAGLNDFHYGIPINLISMNNCDAPEGNDYKRDDGLDSYGIYLNGCLTPNMTIDYIVALDKYGFKEKADLVCRHMLESFEKDTFSGGIGTGTEFYTWEGRPCGYEGLLVGSFPVLAAISNHLGITEPTKEII